MVFYFLLERRTCIIAQKIRIYPTPTQQVLLKEYFDYARYNYNKGLSLWKANYKAGQSPNQYSVCNELKKQIPDWAPKSSKSVLDTACEHLGNAFSNFFAHRAKYPKFKKKNGSKQSFELYHKNDSSIRIRNGKWLFVKEQIKLSEALRFSGVIQRLTCSVQNGKYYISLIFKEDLPTTPDNGIQVGLDWGIRNQKAQGHYFTASDGKVFDLPDMQKYEKHLRFLQHSVSKAQKGSNRSKKAKAKLSAFYERLNNVKKDAQNKLVYKLVSTYGTIAVETISMASLVQKNKGKKAKLRRMLSYSNYEIKAALERKAFQFKKLDMFFPSSQCCSQCGQRHHEMKDERCRTLVCSCGLSIDRDLNAAKNILKYSVAQIK